MKAQIKVNVTEPGSGTPAVNPDASNTTSLAVPDTGAMSANASSIESGIVGAIAIISSVLMLAVFVGLLIKRRKKQKAAMEAEIYEYESSGKSVKKIALGLTAVALVSGAVSFATLEFTNGDLDSVSAIENDEEVPGGLSIEASDINMDVEVDGESVYASADSVVKVNNSTKTGYDLFVYADSSDLTSKGNKIAGVSNEDFGHATLTDNTWGFALDNPIDQTTNVWYGMPAGEDNAINLKSVRTATEAGDETTLHYGVYVTPDLPYGVYTGPTINYVAVANVVEPELVFTFNAGEGLYFDEEKTQQTNTVGYACMCDEGESDDNGGKGGDISPAQECRWVNVLGDYKLPIVPEGESVEFLLSLDSSFVDTMWKNENEFVDFLNRVFDYDTREEITFDVEAVSTFSITYDANGGEFVRSCYEPVVTLLGPIGGNEECIDGSFASETIDYIRGEYNEYGLLMLGYDYRYVDGDIEKGLVGWSTNPDATEPEFFDGEEIQMPDDVNELTLYAIWGERDEFNPNTPKSAPTE